MQIFPLHSLIIWREISYKLASFMLTNHCDEYWVETNSTRLQCHWGIHKRWFSVGNLFGQTKPNWAQ